MNISSLKYVVEVGRVKSITHAAQNLFMGQPNLSKAIKELEQEIGITIFRRTSKGVIPTPQGREFLGYAEGILSQLNELESLYKPRSGESLDLHVVVPRAAYAASAFSHFLNERQKTVQNINIHFRESGANQAIHLVENGEADFGVIRYQASQSVYFEKLFRQYGLRSEVLGKFKMSIMMSCNHPLAGQDKIQYHELAGYPEIVHGDFQTPALSFYKIKKRGEMNSQLRRITVYDRGSQYDLLNQVEGSYLWTSPVPHEVLDRHSLVVRPCAISDELNIDVLISPKDVELSPNAEQLAEELRKAVRSLI